MKPPQNPVTHTLKKTAQILYFPLLLLIISWQKILSLFGFSESRAMNDIVIPMLVITFCVGVPLALAVSAGIYVWHKINKHKKVADTTDQMIVPAPFTWIIENFIGWIYVSEDFSQVGVVGDKLYRKAGFFIERLISSPKRKIILSCQSRNTEVSVATTTRETTRVKVDAIVKYSARPENAIELLRENANPTSVIEKDIEAITTKLIQEYEFKYLMEMKDHVELDLKLKLEKMLKHYDITIMSLKVDGDRVIDRDKLSRKEETVNLSELEMQKRWIEGHADILIDGAKREQEFRQKREALQETQNLFSTDQSPRPAGQNPIGNTPPNKQIGGINPSTFYDELRNISRDSQMQLLTDSPPYRMFYSNHGIQLEIDETKGSISLEIWNSKTKIASVTRPLNVSLQALLLAARKRIDSEAARRPHD